MKFLRHPDIQNERDLGFQSISLAWLRSRESILIAQMEMGHIGRTLTDHDFSIILDDFGLTGLAINHVPHSLIFTEKRMAMQIFPESVRKIWNKWELRAMVLISLSLQAILILIGSCRKHSTSNILRIVLWLAYLSADSVATVSLGILSNNQEDSPAFWAPFLLLHLGGPDTITAYSLEDNELWLRHLLGVAVQVLVAFYVFLRAWSNKVLNFLAIPMFIVGIIKFGERTWVLRSASSEHFRESMLPHPDPGPNYARYMEEYSSKKARDSRLN
ncbi:Protein of unknown function D [Prunus dulcis]|uniref:DUF4220 domain-containing protein n=1 Tax=Prunus dulcis TaxID=3755 RepID=A0A4Y1R3X5_PRUDU|nr:Protein of unknown function D [Prunus dulcis]